MLWQLLHDLPRGHLPDEESFLGWHYLWTEWNPLCVDGSFLIEDLSLGLRVPLSASDQRV